MTKQPNEIARQMHDAMNGAWAELMTALGVAESACRDGNDVVDTAIHRSFDSGFLLGVGFISKLYGQESNLDIAKSIADGVARDIGATLVEDGKQ